MRLNQKSKVVACCVLTVLFLSAFDVGQDVELNSFLNAHSSARFSKNNGDHNVQFTLPKGSILKIDSTKHFSSGNYGLEVTIENDPHKGEKTWVYYNTRSPAMTLYKGDVGAADGAPTTPAVATDTTTATGTSSKPAGAGEANGATPVRSPGAVSNPAVANSAQTTQPVTATQTSQQRAAIPDLPKPPNDWNSKVDQPSAIKCYHALNQAVGRPAGADYPPGYVAFSHQFPSPDGKKPPVDITILYYDNAAKLISGIKPDSDGDVQELWADSNQDKAFLALRDKGEDVLGKPNISNFLSENLSEQITDFANYTYDSIGKKAPDPTAAQPMTDADQKKIADQLKAVAAQGLTGQSVGPTTAADTQTRAENQSAATTTPVAPAQSPAASPAPATPAAASSEQGPTVDPLKIIAALQVCEQVKDEPRISDQAKLSRLTIEQKLKLPSGTVAPDAAPASTGAATAK